jgi:proline iminopeptidase
VTGPVVLYAGELDPMVPPTLLRQAAPLFNDATVIVQPNAGHFPWVDDPAAFAAAITSFLN